MVATSRELGKHGKTDLTARTFIVLAPRDVVLDTLSSSSTVLSPSISHWWLHAHPFRRAIKRLGHPQERTATASRSVSRANACTKVKGFAIGPNKQVVARMTRTLRPWRFIFRQFVVCQHGRIGIPVLNVVVVVDNVFGRIVNHQRPFPVTRQHATMCMTWSRRLQSCKGITQ